LDFAIPHRLPMVFESLGNSWVGGVGVPPNALSYFGSAICLPGREPLLARKCEVRNWHESEAEGGQSQFGFAPVLQTSTCSAKAEA
jgi:hypothetical protein